MRALPLLSLLPLLVAAAWSGDGLPKVAARVERVASAKGCTGGATLVRVGVDANGNGVLEDTEGHDPPTVLCSSATHRVEIVDAPADRFCPRAHRDAWVARAGAPPHVQIVVCFDAGARAIESTYVVYGAQR